jgi:hypothetical protein
MIPVVDKRKRIRTLNSAPEDRSSTSRHGEQKVKIAGEKNGLYCGLRLYYDHCRISVFESNCCTSVASRWMKYRLEKRGDRLAHVPDASNWLGELRKILLATSCGFRFAAKQ